MLTWSRSLPATSASGNPTVCFTTDIIRHMASSVLIEYQQVLTFSIYLEGSLPHCTYHIHKKQTLLRPCLPFLHSKTCTYG